MDEQLTKILRNKAVQLLAQRDHSSYELSQKLMIFLTKYLSKKIDPTNNDDAICEQIKTEFSTQITEVIEYCIAHHWLNDIEYATKYIEMQARKGYGKYRIVMELKRRGLSIEMLQSALHQTDINWIEVAMQQIIKKFKKIDKKDLIQKKKIIQFLLSRGFAQDEIKSAYFSFDEFM